MEQYRIVVVEREKKPYEETMTFDQITELVGHVTPLHLYDDVYAFVDEDARLRKVKPSRTVVLQEKSPIPISILGTFVVMKQNKSNTKLMGLTDEEVKEALYIFRSESEDSTIFI